MQSSNASSDWDFTAVIDLLHTPTRPLPASIHATSSEPNKEPPRTPQDTAGDRSLGDFTRLWEFLHPSTTALPESPGGNVSDEPSGGLSFRPVSILKRTPKTETSGNNSADVLSDSTTAAESDGDLSVFDSVVSSNSALSFVPSQVNHSGKGRVLASLTPPSSYEDDSTLPSLIPKKIITAQDTARPAYTSPVERKAGLVFKLSKQFPDFSLHTPASSKYSKAPSKVHVFVDLSNISIGLHDSYKIQHGIPLSTHIKRLPLSFHNFSLILERGRPVAKRVLAGSDRFAAINEAEMLGYEVNILSRVHKAKEWTPRQLKFRNAFVSAGREGSETGPSSERWVEQCVDEILHLKMLESLVDTDQPATIVLATGDAAEAEFSGGFLRMVERALQKGWSIELVSFAMNTSFAYKRKEFRAKWGARFRMINLEEYVEEMLDM